MLSAIRKIFSGHDDATATADFHSEPILDNPNFITHPARIVNLLQQVMEAPPLCSVSVIGANEIFSTSILDVQPEKDLIILDRLVPASGNSLLISHRTLKLSAYLNGIPLTFNLTGIAAGGSQTSVFYNARLPEKIYYPQRRSAPRIAINSTPIGFRGTSSETRMTISGTVFDFSRGGIGVNFSNDRGLIQRGDTLTDCLIMLPDSYSLSFDLSVRFVKKASLSSRQKQIGGNFTALLPQDRKRLERYISTLEREQIRKRKN